MQQLSAVRADEILSTDEQIISFFILYSADSSGRRNIESLLMHKTPDVGRNYSETYFDIHTRTINNKLCFCNRQVPDYLIYKGDTIAIFSNPLVHYFERKWKRELIDFAGCGSVIDGGILQMIENVGELLRKP